MLGLTGSIALQVGSNQCLQKAHFHPPVFVKSAVTIIAVYHLYLFAIFLKTRAATIRIITKVQTLTIVPLKVVVKMLNAKLAISPSTAKYRFLSATIVITEKMSARVSVIVLRLLKNVSNPNTIRLTFTFPPCRNSKYNFR